jgi:hypothetical protein
MKRGEFITLLLRLVVRAWVIQEALMVDKTALPSKLDDPLKALEEERKIMSAYTDTAKTYSQLSLGALVLSVTFIEKFVDSRATAAISAVLLVAWCGWLAAALSGAFYQYLAVRFLEARGENLGVLIGGNHIQWFKRLADRPWPAYAIMLVAFGVGSCAFLIFGLQHLLSGRPPLPSCL